MSKTKVQKPILSSEGALTDTDIEKTTENRTKPTETQKPFVKSRKRMSLTEFAIDRNLRSEFVAGFSVWLNGQHFHFENEWDRLLSEYKNRKLVRR